MGKALQSILGELTNNLTKLKGFDEHIANEKQKIQVAGGDEFQEECINARIKNFEDEKSFRLDLLAPICGV